MPAPHLAGARLRTCRFAPVGAPPVRYIQRSSHGGLAVALEDAGKGATYTMSIRSRLLPGLVTASLLLAACTSAATPAPTAAPAVAPSAAPTKTTDGTLPKPEITKIKISATIAEAGQFATMLALRMGIYEKYGLQAEVVIFNDDGGVLQAMLSGRADMAQLGVAGIVSSVNTDTPARIFGMMKVKVIDGLFCNSAIKTAADLKGKAVGISTLGSTAHGTALLALEALGLKGTDVTFQTVGGQSTRLAALKAGAIACGPISMDQENDLRVLGFNTLVDLSKSNLQYPASSISATVAFAQKNPNTVLAVVASHLEAINFMVNNTEQAAAMYAAHAQVSNERALTSMKAVKNEVNPSLKWTKDGFLFTQKIMSIVNPAIMNVDVTKAYDESLLKTLEDIGFYKKVGAPTK